MIIFMDYCFEIKSQLDKCKTTKWNYVLLKRSTLYQNENQMSQTQKIIHTHILFIPSKLLFNTITTPFHHSMLASVTSIHQKEQQKNRTCPLPPQKPCAIRARRNGLQYKPPTIQTANSRKTSIHSNATCKGQQSQYDRLKEGWHVQDDFEQSWLSMKRMMHQHQHQQPKKHLRRNHRHNHGNNHYC